MLDTFYAFYTPGATPHKVVAGIPDEVVGRLTERGMAFERPNTYGAGTGITYDPESLKRVWDELAGEAGRDAAAARVRVRRRGGRGPRRVGRDRDEERRPPRSPASSSTRAATPTSARSPARRTRRPGDDVQSLSTVFRVANVDVARAAGRAEGGAAGG